MKEHQAASIWAIGLTPHLDTETRVDSVDRSLAQLEAFIEGRATFIGWEHDDPEEGWALIYVLDASVLTDLETQPFVAQDPTNLKADITPSQSLKAEFH